MDWILIGIILTSFFIIGSSRLTASIRAVALQGGLLSLLPAMARGTLMDPHSLGLFLGTFAIKAFGIPYLLFRSIRETTLRREREVASSQHFSLLAGGLLVVLVFSWKFSSNSYSPLIIPTALSTVLLGFLILVLRTKAVSQVIGFLVLENGIFLFGMTLVSHFPMTVEIGVLLDLLVGVLVMGIMIYHINRTFDHIDTKALSSLKDVL